MSPAAAPAIAPGFADPVFDAQSLFRAVMMAMARPGTIETVAPVCAPPAPLTATAAAVALSLADFETPLWLDQALAASDAASSYLAFHTGAPFADATHDAAFALISQPRRMPPFSAFAQGSAEYPDRSTTLILQVDTLANDDGVTLSGPGIETERTFSAAPLPPIFWQEAERNRALFPRGIDVIFAADGRVAALPRSTMIAVEAR